MSVLTDVRLLESQGDTVYTNVCCTPVGAVEAQVLARSDRNDLMVENVTMTAAAVRALGGRPFTVGKPFMCLMLTT